MQTRIISISTSLRHGWLLRAAAALLALGAIAAIPVPAQAGVFVSVNIAPPILPVYAQPIIPGPGYLWTPGYWDWSGGGYYWVPGTWVLPPYTGALWTPGYWGWGNGVYVFHRGYWGQHVGFYGGINYGYGYAGRGYEGGYWRGGGFYYNTSVNHVGGNIRNVYNRTVINNTTIVNDRRVSFNGGPRGTSARATTQEQGWQREQRHGPVAAQLQQRTMASRTPSLRAAANHGTPPIAATSRAGAFQGRDSVAARGAPNVMNATAAQQADAAPRTTPPPRSDGAMRSAGFAPHGNSSTRSTRAGRTQPAARGRSYATPDANRATPREVAPVTRGPQYRPQDARASRPQVQAQRPASDYARGNNQPNAARPAVTHAAASRDRTAPAKQRERRGGDQQHP